MPIDPSGVDIQVPSLRVGSVVYAGDCVIGSVVGFSPSRNPILQMQGSYSFTAEFSTEQYHFDELDADKFLLTENSARSSEKKLALPSVYSSAFPVGTKVDSSLICLFKRINRGEVLEIHPDGMVMVRWDHEGDCLQHVSELRKVSTIWDHLKHA